MIIDLSYPEGNSVNDFIPDSEASVAAYSSIGDAISMIIRCGKGTLMVKFDIKSGYRIIVIHSKAWHLFEMCWRDKIFIDLCLAFGLHSTCQIFTDFVDILEWIPKFCAFIWFLINYLDDFLCVPITIHQRVKIALKEPKLLVKNLGFLWPTTRLWALLQLCLSWELNQTVLFEARLPATKLEKAKQLINIWKLKWSGKK